MFEVCEYNCVVCKIMMVVDEVNCYIDEWVFWVFVKEEGKEEELYVVLMMGINFFCIFMVWFKLVLLVIVIGVEEFFVVDLLLWGDVLLLLYDYVVNKYKLFF